MEYGTYYGVWLPLLRAVNKKIDELWPSEEANKYLIECGAELERLSREMERDTR